MKVKINRPNIPSMKTILIKAWLLLFTLFLVDNVNSQISRENQLVHTYSIVAKDKVTGEMAVGVQSHWFSVGTIVSWGQSGVGVVATQSFVNPAFGPDGLKLLKEGKDAKQALDILMEGDEGRDFRQLAVLDNEGIVSA